jgi:hypothetical protein
MLVFIMPLINIILLVIAHKNINKLEDENIKELFGAFYEDFENKKIAGLFYQLIYFVRRDLFIVTSFMLSDYKFKRAQFIIICFLNLLAS